MIFKTSYTERESRVEIIFNCNKNQIVQIELKRKIDEHKREANTQKNSLIGMINLSHFIVRTNTNNNIELFQFFFFYN